MIVLLIANWKKSLSNMCVMFLGAPSLKITLAAPIDILIENFLILKQYLLIMSEVSSEFIPI